MKAALLAYKRLLEVDKAAFPSLVDVLGKNRYPKFFFSQVRLFSVHSPCRTRQSCGFKETQGIKQKSLR